VAAADCRAVVLAGGATALVVDGVASSSPSSAHALLTAIGRVGSAPVVPPAGCRCFPGLGGPNTGEAWSRSPSPLAR
jgi:hypothetical protein